MIVSSDDARLVRSAMRTATAHTQRPATNIRRSGYRVGYNTPHNEAPGIIADALTDDRFNCNTLNLRLAAEYGLPEDRRRAKEIIEWRNTLAQALTRIEASSASQWRSIIDDLAAGTSSTMQIKDLLVEYPSDSTNKILIRS